MPNHWKASTNTMGYSHSWNRPATISADLFRAIGNDLLQLLPALESAGVPLANPYGREEPEIGPEFIGFNGVEYCGHQRNPEVRLSWPSKDAHGIGSNAGVGSPLPYRTCNGDCSYESLWFERVVEHGQESGHVFGACKTAFRPYDLAVTAFLVIAKHHIGSALEVETDGEPGHWAEAFALCHAALSYRAVYRFHGRSLVCLEEALCG